MLPAEPTPPPTTAPTAAPTAAPTTAAPTAAPTTWNCACGFDFIPNTAATLKKVKVWCEHATNNSLILAWDQTANQKTYTQLLKDQLPSPHTKNVSIQEHPDVAGCKYLKVHYESDLNDIEKFDYYLHLSIPSNSTDNIEKSLPLVYTGAASVPAQ